MLLRSKSLHSNHIRLVAYYTTAAEVPVNIPQPRISSSQVAEFRRGGSGGRASFSGSVITVFGASGYLGQRLVNRLAKHGHQLILPYRCDPYWVRELKINGDLGQIQFFPFNLKNEDEIYKTVKYSNVVINLLGTNVNTKNFSMYDTHEHGARRIARISREAGVDRFIHISALNADPDYKSRVIKNADFLRSKGLGEIAIQEEFSNATIIRPGLMYGAFDKFIYPTLSRWRKSPMDWIKVFKAGENTFKMPIFVNDVVAGISKAVLDPTSNSKTYEFVGPYNYRLSELIDFMFAKARVIQRMGHTYRRHDHFDPWFSIIKFLCKYHSKVFRKHVPINMEWIEFIEGANDVLTGVLTLADLGIYRLTEFENVGAYHAAFNSYSRVYEERLGEIDHIPSLPIRSPSLYKGQPLPVLLKAHPIKSTFLYGLADTFRKSTSLGKL